jgi:ActR/RegA family two-component response regulator
MMMDIGKILKMMEKGNSAVLRRPLSNTAEKSHCILLVGAETAFLSVMAKALHEEGFLCDCASTVARAFAALESRPYSLVIADIDMSGNQELEIVRRLREEAPGTGVIVITGAPTVLTAVLSLRLGAVDYLTRPVDLPVLVSSVSAVARRQQQTCVGDQPSWALKDFLGQAVHQVGQIAASLDELLQMANHGRVEPLADVCAGLRCPRLVAYEAGLHEAIAVLQKTKNAFKSKDLGKLRVKLAALLQ